MDFTKLYSETIKTLHAYVDLARPYNAVAAVLSFSMGYYLYSPQSQGLDFLLGFVVVALLHSTFTMQNDLYDLDVDTANHRSTPLTRGTVSPRALQQTILYLVFIAFILAWLTAYPTPGFVFICGYTLIAWVYNSPPVQASRRPVLSIALLGLFYALLPAIYGFALSGNSWTKDFWLLGLLLATVRISISILKDFKDASGDKQKGKSTFYLVYGRRVVASISILLAAIGYTFLVFFILSRQGNVHQLLAYLLIMAGLLSVFYRCTLLSAKSEKRLTRIFQNSFRGQHYFEGVILACLIS